MEENWQADAVLDVLNEPILHKGLDLLAAKGDLLLAICLNNGYYNAENTYRMLRFANAFSSRIQIFFTDGPAKHNYRAMGKTEAEIMRKCRLHRNRLRNHCERALERIGATESQVAQFAYMDWVSIYGDLAYQQYMRK